VAELTELVDLSAWPPGTRLILRKERPHPGAQLRITDHNGMRITGLLTNTPPGGAGRQLADLELRHRRHARVEDRIRAGKDTGIRNLPTTTPRRTRSGWPSPRWPPTCWPGPPASPSPAHRDLRTQTAATADSGRGRPNRAHRPPPPPQDRPSLALGRADHHRARPVAGPASPLTTHPYPDNKDPEHRPQNS
jgi:hypothetical protein